MVDHNWLKIDDSTNIKSMVWLLCATSGLIQKGYIDREEDDDGNVEITVRFKNKKFASFKKAVYYSRM